MNLNTEHYDRRTKRPRGAKRKNTSAPALTRNGKEFPGGRTLRRRLAKLAKRNASMPTAAGFTAAGSMTK